MTTTSKTTRRLGLLADPDGAGPSDLPPGYGPIQRPCQDGDCCPEYAVHGRTGEVLLWDSANPDVRVLLTSLDAARALGRDLAAL
jgi:hypothetical protein